MYKKRDFHKSFRRTLSTLALVLADVSTYWTAHSSAFPRASSTDTCRRSSRSDLFPTSRRGILSSSAFTRRICSLSTQSRSWTCVTNKNVMPPCCFQVLLLLKRNKAKLQLFKWDESFIWSMWSTDWSSLVWRCFGFYRAAELSIQSSSIWMRMRREAIKTLLQPLIHSQHTHTHHFTWADYSDHKH